MNFDPIHRSLARRHVTVVGAVMIGALVAALLSGCNSQAEPAGHPPPPSVNAAPVLAKDLAQWDEYTGRIEAVGYVELRPRVSGYIDRVNYTEGQSVKKGDILFTIDARSYRTELARAEAELARVRSQAAQSESEAERARGLSSLQAISKEAFDQRRAAAAVAQANVQAAQAAVDSAKLNLEWTQVRAPIAGRAGRALVTAGNLVSSADANSVLTTLVSEDRVYAYFDADEASFLRYGESTRNGGVLSSGAQGGLPVQVALADEQGFKYSGVVDFVDNRLDRNTGTIRVRAVLDNKNHTFTPGLFARVRLQGEQKSRVLLIDDRAVMTDQDRKYVYVVDAEGKAQRKDVKLGRTAEGLRIVQSGLAEGDKVVVAGIQKIFMPGMPVNATAVSMSPPSESAAPAVAMK